MKLLPWKLLRKCIFCGKRQNLEFTNEFGIYGAVSTFKYAFHMLCLENVMMEPEKYGHKNVDAALNICDLKKRHESIKETQQELYLKRCSELRKMAYNTPWWTMKKFGGK